MNMFVRSLCLGIFCVFCAVPPGYSGGAAAGAGPAASPVATSGETRQLERFVVTGSALPALEGETFAPVTIFSAPEMARLGAATPIEVVRQLPGFIGHNATEQRTSGGTGAAEVNFRGLGGALSLFDGKRTSGLVNYNVIPLIVIDRIEVLKDGAGAIYGADALAGVFNVRPVTRYEGAKVELYYGNTTRNDAGVQRAGVLFGRTVRQTNVVVASEYYRRNALHSTDRSPSNQADNRFRGGVNGGSPVFSGRATARVGSATAPVQNLVLEPGKTVGLTADDFIPFNPSPATSDQMLNFRDYTPSIPAAERASAYLRINQRLFADRVEGHVRLLHTRDRFYNGLAPAPMPLTGTAGNALRDANRLSPHIPDGFFIADNVNSTPGNVTNGVVPFRTIALGPRQQIYTRRVWEFSAGLDGRLGEDWTWNVDFLYGVNRRNQLQQGAPGRAKLVENILAGRYNPWALDTASGTGPTGVAFDNPAALIDSAASGDTYDVTRNRGADFDFTGPLFALPAGDARLGFGGDYYRRNFSLTPEPIFFTGDLLGLGGANPTISRGYGGGVFAEVQVPVVSPAMNIPFVRSLKFSLGGRHDEQTVEGYQDGASGAAIGGSFASRNPRAGWQWQPVRDLLWRGTWGTGFRLPSLLQLFRAPGTSHPRLIDPLGFPIASQTPITTGGNPDLTPEKSETLSVGLVWSPRSLGGLSLTADYYSGRIEGLVGEGAQFILDTNAAGQGPAFVPGNAATINPNAPFADRITRAASGAVTTVRSTNFNIAARETTGVDWALAWLWPARDAGRLTTRLEGNTTLTWDLTPRPGQPPASFLGKYIDPAQNAISPGSIPRHRGALSQSWEKDGWSAYLRINYVGRLEDNPAFTAGNVLRHIEAWPTCDFSIAHRFDGGPGWGRWLANTALRLGAINVTDEPAPFAAGASNDSYDASTHSNRGRFIYTRITRTF